MCRYNEGITNDKTMHVFEKVGSRIRHTIYVKLVMFGKFIYPKLVYISYEGITNDKTMHVFEKVGSRISQRFSAK